MDSKHGQPDAYPPPANQPSLTGMSLVWHERAAEVSRSCPLRSSEAGTESLPESPCIPRTKRQHDRGQADPAAILPGGCLRRPEQAQEARLWLVRVLARRGVEILKAKQGEQT